MGRTVAIRHPRDPNRPWVIPADRYNPSSDVLWEEDAPRGERPKPADLGVVRNLPDVPVEPERLRFQTDSEVPE